MHPTRTLFRVFLCLFFSEVGNFFLTSFFASKTEKLYFQLIFAVFCINQKRIGLRASHEVYPLEVSLMARHLVL